MPSICEVNTQAKLKYLRDELDEETKGKPNTFASNPDKNHPYCVSGTPWRLKASINMSEYYFINQHIVIPDNTAILDKVSSDVELDPVDLLAGAKLRSEPTAIEVTLSQTSGDYFPDMFSIPIPLVSNTIKSTLDQCGIKNIDFYPATLIDVNQNIKVDNYWLINVLGRFNCIDENKSDIRRNALGNLKFKSFCIDENKTLAAEFFRLNERGRMIIISERIYQALASQNLKGVILKNTRNFDGYGI